MRGMLIGMLGNLFFAAAGPANSCHSGAKVRFFGIDRSMNHASARAQNAP
jgi:hypothetical protein